MGPSGFCAVPGVAHAGVVRAPGREPKPCGLQSPPLLVRGLGPQLSAPAAGWVPLPSNRRQQSFSRGVTRRSAPSQAGRSTPDLGSGSSPPRLPTPYPAWLWDGESGHSRPRARARQDPRPQAACPLLHWGRGAPAPHLVSRKLHRPPPPPRHRPLGLGELWAPTRDIPGPDPQHCGPAS